MRHQPAAESTSSLYRFQEQRVDGVTGESHEADWQVLVIGEHEKLQSRGREVFRDQRSIEDDVVLCEKAVRGVDGSLPEGKQRCEIGRTMSTDTNVIRVSPH